MKSTPRLFWYERAIRNGSIKAYCDAAILYEWGAQESMDYNKAIECLKQIIDINPNNKDAKCEMSKYKKTIFGKWTRIW